MDSTSAAAPCWESFIISLDILNTGVLYETGTLRIFHYQPWYTYYNWEVEEEKVENLSLSALIYLQRVTLRAHTRWESFIISLDILMRKTVAVPEVLRIFHYQPWYTYHATPCYPRTVENLSLSALIYLWTSAMPRNSSWESFIISLDILIIVGKSTPKQLRIFHYQPWYTYSRQTTTSDVVENLSLSALIYLRYAGAPTAMGWESFIISLDILTFSRSHAS